MADNKPWIEDATKEHPGAFARKAEKAGMSTSKFAAHVKSNPDKHDEKTVKQANLASTLMKLRKRQSNKG